VAHGGIQSVDLLAVPFDCFVRRLARAEPRLEKRPAWAAMALQRGWKREEKRRFLWGGRQSAKCAP
jgi:hypothetical protein